jgi:cephalosporin-C deacetylase-like acetyl esterase
MIENCESAYFLESVLAQMKVPLSRRRSAVNSIFATNNELQARRRTEDLKQRIAGLINADFPRCGLDPVKTGSIDCGEYVIDKMLVKTFEQSYVPVNVYRLKNAAGRRPAVIVPLGHWPEGKARSENQIMCANLCLNGFIVFTFDPQYQGERANKDDDFSDLDREDFICVANHMKAALPQFLYGRQFMAYYLWDGMRVLDYICSREDVDAEKIGGIGQSGGGTQISFLSALDDRIKAVVAIQYLTSAEEDLHWNGVGDAEQAAFGLYNHGFDKADLGWMIAPRPLLLNAALKDEIFPLEGVMRLKDELKTLYSLYGIPERLELNVSDSTHCVHKQTREGCYYWMNKWIAKKEGFLPERDTRVFSVEELSCGYVEKSKKDAIILAGEEYRALVSKRPSLPDKNRALINFFGNVEREKYEYYSIDREESGGRTIERFRIHTAKSFDIDGTLSSCPGSTETVVILDMENRGLSAGCTDGANVLVLRPFGAYYTNRENKKIRYDLQSCVVQTLFALGTDMVSIRVNGILCALEHVKKTTPQAASFRFVTTGGGGILALVAGLFEDTISAIHTDGMLASYSGIIENRNAFINDADIIVNFAKQFDIADLIQANGDKKIEVKNPTDPFGRRQQD